MKIENILRPITDLPPAPLRDVRWQPPMPGSAWVRRQVVENLPEPFSPLFEELYIRQGLERSLDALMLFFGMPGFHMEDIADNSKGVPSWTREGKP